MQTSGICPPLSDGTRKTITTAAPRPAASAKRINPAPKAAPSTHRAGGHAKHARRGK